MAGAACGGNCRPRRETRRHLKSLGAKGKGAVPPDGLADAGGATSGLRTRNRPPKAVWPKVCKRWKLNPLWRELRDFGKPTGRTRPPFLRPEPSADEDV